MSSAPTIAILADFPVWKITDQIPTPSGHYGVWLLALYESGALPENWNIHWITLHKQTAKPIHVQKGNHHFHIIPQAKKMIGLFTAYWQDRNSIKKTIEAIRPDLVHAWGTEHAYALAGGDFPGIRVLSMQGIITAYCQRSRMPFFFRIQQFWERKALKKYSVVTTESPWGRDRILELAPKARVELIEYGVEEDCYRITKNLSPSPSCLYAGSITHTKGSDTLVDCFSRPELSGIELRIAGSGDPEFVASLKEKATANITFLGRISRSDIMNELTQTWCLVHPTLADTSPNIVKEARCCGTPVVTTPEGGQTQYVVEGLSGFICPVGNIDSMTKAIITTTESPEKSLAMGDYDVETCRAALQPALTAKKIETLYTTLLNDPVM